MLFPNSAEDATRHLARYSLLDQGIVTHTFKTVTTACQQLGKRGQQENRGQPGQ